MSRTSPPSLTPPQPSPSPRARLAHLVTRAAVTSSAFALGLILPIKYPEALGE
jgi:hypothetical protein